jgi:hypothetical protein
MNDNREIFEVPGVYENPRRQTLTLALTANVMSFLDMRHFQQYFSYISWRSVLLVKETGGPGENHRPAASH